MKISIIVLNYNGGEFVKECFRAIFAQKTPFTYEVIVVDNASSDGSREVISSQFPQVRLIANKSNLGFSRANNQAIKLTSSPYVLLLNIDAYLIEEDFLEKAVSFMERRKDSAAIGPEIISREGKVLNPYYRSFPNLTTEFLTLSGLLPLYNFFNRGKYFYTRDGLACYQKGQKAIMVSHLCGACMFLRRKAIEEVGLLDEKMFIYREDMDLSLRLRENGWKLFVLPYITAIHIGGSSHQTVSFSVGGMATKNIYIFFKKNYGEFQYLSLRLIHLVTASLRILGCLMLRLLTKSSPKALAYYKAVFKESLSGIVG